MPLKLFNMEDLAVFPNENFKPTKNISIDYLDTGSITNNLIERFDHFTYYTKMPSRARKKVQYNDIIFSTVRPNKLHYGILKCNCDNLIVSTGFSIIRANVERVLPEYLYYLLTQKSVVDRLQSVAEQSATSYPSITDSDIKSLTFEIPDLDTQWAIVSIINPIDELICIKRSINDNLGGVTFAS